MSLSVALVAANTRTGGEGVMRATSQGNGDGYLHKSACARLTYIKKQNQVKTMPQSKNALVVIDTKEGKVRAANQSDTQTLPLLAVLVCPKSSRNLVGRCGQGKGGLILKRTDRHDTQPRSFLIQTVEHMRKQ